MDEDETDDEIEISLAAGQRRAMDTGVRILGPTGLLTRPTPTQFELLSEYIGTPQPLVVSLAVTAVDQPGTTFPTLETQLVCGVSSAAAPYVGAWFHQNGGCARIEYGRGADHRVMFLDLCTQRFQVGICDYCRVSVQRYNPTLIAGLAGNLRISSGIHVSDEVCDMPFSTAVRFLVTAAIASEAMPVPVRAKHFSAWAVNETTANITGPRWNGAAANNPIYHFTGAAENATLSYQLNLRIPSGPRWNLGTLGQVPLLYAQTQAAPASHSLVVRFFMSP